MTELLGLLRHWYKIEGKTTNIVVASLGEREIGKSPCKLVFQRVHVNSFLF